MKSTLNSLIIAAVCTCSLCCYADDLTPTPPDDPILIPIKKPGNGRPRVPAKVTITAYYQEGVLAFTGVEAFGTLAATVTNDLTGECRSAFIDEASPEMEVPTAAGTYTICLTTLDGQELYGHYTIF